jgi:hypothetical protein
MRSYVKAETEFVSRLRARGTNEALAWLPHEDFAFLGGVLVIRTGTFPVQSADVARAHALLRDEPCTFALVARSDVAYVTLLMDTFGTDEAADFDASENAYYLVEPYFKGDVKLAGGGLEWFWSKQVLERIRRPLSSLDYAFGRRQVRAI